MFDPISNHLHALTQAHACADLGPIPDPDGMLARLQQCQAVITADQLAERQAAAVELRFQQRLAEDAANVHPFRPPYADSE